MTVDIVRAERLASCLGSWSRASGPLYVRLADGLRRAVDRGDLPPTTRLPAERNLAAALLVSRGTVVAAYERLRVDGVLDSRQGSGTWIRAEAARPVTALTDSAPGAPSRALSGRLFDRPGDIIDLAISAVRDLGCLPATVFDLPDAAGLERVSGGHGYQPLGLIPLRERLAAQFGREGVPTDPAHVGVTCGAQQAISRVAQLLVRPGDTVVVEAPTYPGALDVFTRSGARLVTVPADAPVDTVRRAVALTGARLVYVMPACSNPGGRVVPEGRRRDLARLADEHNVCVVEDNSLAEVVFGPRLAPVAAFSRSGRVLSIGSLSKVAWGGLRIGWVRGPVSFIDALGRLQAATDVGLSPLPQLVAVNVLDDLPAIAAARTAQLQHRRKVAEAQLAALLPDWRWTRPEGGLSLWLRLPAGSADGLVQVALRHGVDVTPGSAHTVAGGFGDRLRLSYGVAPALLREGIARLAAAEEEYRAALAWRAAG